MWLIKTINAAIASEDVSWREQQNLEAKKECINELNVFPVPDGDTGTNMTLTITVSGKRSNGAGESGYGDPVQKQFLPDLLRGARGNSGVILVPASPWLYKGDQGT